jgi:hypothetical protein
MGSLAYRQLYLRTRGQMSPRLGMTLFGMTKIHIQMSYLRPSCLSHLGMRSIALIGGLRHRNSFGNIPLTQSSLTGLSGITNKCILRLILSIFILPSLCCIIPHSPRLLRQSHWFRLPRLLVACFRRVPVIPMKPNLERIRVEICGKVDKRSSDKWFVVRYH